MPHTLYNIRKSAVRNESLNNLAALQVYHIHSIAGLPLCRVSRCQLLVTDLSCYCTGVPHEVQYG
jgi:hypothetical protein